MNRRLSCAVVCLTAATMTLTGCSPNGSSATSAASSNTSSVTATGTPASGPDNDADVSFATDMIPHHAQAVEMADMALEQATSPQITSLANQIKAAQDPEMATMSAWLTGSNKPVSPTTVAMGGMDHSMGTGMTSDADMNSPAAASGAAFDRMWVTMMIEHHTGALDMAETEVADGQNADAQALATSIITGQCAEIAATNQLLNQLPAA